MKLNKILLFLILEILFLLICMPQCFAGTQELNSLDFDITVNDLGDVTIVETWDIRVSDTNTLFKTFEYDANYSFENAYVVDMTNGQSTRMNDVGQYMYHVTPGGYYALNNKGDFEIAWSADCENITRNKKYQLVYTITNLVDMYNDCADLYWKLIGYDFEIPARNITGTIHLPQNVNNLENLRVWAHGPLSGEIHKVDNKTVSFTLPDLNAGEFLEIRVVTPVEIYEGSINKINSNMLNAIIQQETEWADEANAKRENALRMAKMVSGAIVVISLVVVVTSVKGMGEAKTLLYDAPSQKVQELDYFREMPDENATPGEAEFIRGIGLFNTQNVFSAILMDLSLKKLIDFEPNPEKKNDVYLIVNPFEENTVLKGDESSVYSFISQATGNSNRISMKDFKKYCEAHETKTYNLWQGLKDKAISQTIDKKSYDLTIKKQGNKYSGKSSSKYGIAIFGLCAICYLYFSSYIIMDMYGKLAIATAIIAGIISVLCGKQYSKLAKAYFGFTIQGWEEHQRWKGLKKYMEDFSLLNEKDIPDLTLWEHFLVYATAFGISEKVLKQLKIKYPQLQDDDYFLNHYRTMYYANRFDVGRSFGASMSRGYSSYVSSQMSSGSGGGGGFSGGGGGGGHGGGGGGGR